MRDAAWGQKELRIGEPMVLSADTQFAYVDPHVGAIRDALERGWSVSIAINSVGADPIVVYEIYASTKSIGELVADYGIMFGVGYEKPERYKIARFGADVQPRQQILASLDAGFPVFLIPVRELSQVVRYEFWGAVFEEY